MKAVKALIVAERIATNIVNIRIIPKLPTLSSMEIPYNAPGLKTLPKIATIGKYTMENAINEINPINAPRITLSRIAIISSKSNLTKSVIMGADTKHRSIMNAKVPIKGISVSIANPMPAIILRIVICFKRILFIHFSTNSLSQNISCVTNCYCDGIYGIIEFGKFILTQCDFNHLFDIFFSGASVAC